MKNLIKITFNTLLITLLLIYCHGVVSAQAPAKEKKWNFQTDVYLLFPNIDGETGIGNTVTVPIDANPGDIFSKLKMGGMLYLEAKTGKWAITSDLVFMNLNEEITPGTIITSGEVTGKQLIWELAGLYRVAPFLEIGAGNRLNNLQVAIDAQRKLFPQGTEDVSGDKSKTWMDPILIARLTTDIKEKWLFQFRGDIGGFGIGSDFTWQLEAYAGYRFSKLFQLKAGYRYISIDYDKGADDERFIFNVDEFGPEIKLGFSF
ncbi:MAG TPA: hypothetical protein VN249_09090 [Prolixibacteraceae bacterium]|nr:hypothetical protein [Prolixibacteraceae bacterium]